MQLADAGVFTCVAASPAGVADRNFSLQVHGKGQRCAMVCPRPWGVRRKACVSKHGDSVCSVHPPESLDTVGCQELTRDWGKAGSRVTPATRRSGRNTAL